MIRGSRPGAASLTWLVITLATCLATAGELSGADRAAALALFEQGRQLMVDGAYERACGKFAESLRLVPGVGTRFNLAECQEKSGKLASAWANYLEVAATTRQAGQPERERAARQRAAALKPRIPTILIAVPENIEGLVVWRNGKQVPPAQWNAELPVDPGEFRFEAVAPDHYRRRVLAVVAAEGKTVRVELGPLKREAPPPSDDGSERSNSGSSLSANAAEAADVRATSGWILGGIGLAQAVAGAVMLGVGESMKAVAEDECPDRTCSSITYVDMNETGRNLTFFGAPMLGVGAGAAVAGAVLVATASPSEQARQASVSPRFWAAPGLGRSGAALAVGGAW